MLTSLTFTGADESVDPAELLRITLAYPQAEFGILNSVNGFSKPRYPGPEWLREVAGIKRRFPDKQFRISLHLCKQAATNVDSHSINPFGDLWWFIPYIDRLQLNFPEFGSYEQGSLLEFMLGRPDLPIIIQQRSMMMREQTDPILQFKNYANRYALPLQILFDPSGGRGMSPDYWPVPDTRFTFGYAGGLNPDNLEEQLLKIGNVTGANSYWIDMETGVRSADDFKLFSLDRVCQCLQIAERFLDEKIRNNIQLTRVISAHNHP